MRDELTLVNVEGWWTRKGMMDQDFCIIDDVYRGDTYRMSLFANRNEDMLVVDVGAHIGCWAKMMHQKYPMARIVCIEACPENIPALQANVGDFATIIHGACTYEDGPVVLLNSVMVGGNSTGNSVVVPVEQVSQGRPVQNEAICYQDFRELRKVTLEDVLNLMGYDHIEFLKLDCEGSEYSILGKCPVLHKVRFIVGEYHYKDKWEALRKERFARWDYGHMSECGDRLGIFHLVNPDWITPDVPLKVAVPAGIGDTLWVLTKLPALLAKEGRKKALLTVCGDHLFRSRDFLKSFDFVADVEYDIHRSVVESEPHTTPEGYYNYAPSQPHWHHQFDWMLQANGHLERGLRLEDWLPELDIDWNIMQHYRSRPGDVDYARWFREAVGPYCVFYFGPERANTVSGHNRGPLWTPQDWRELGRLIQERLGIRIVCVGADWDRAYYENYIEWPTWLNYIGRWPIGRTVEVIRESRFLIGFQSGLGVISTYLGVPTAMFWRPKGDSILPERYLSFEEDMATAWCPPDALFKGKYRPLIYTKCSPKSIVSEIQRQGW